MHLECDCGIVLTFDTHLAGPSVGSLFGRADSHGHEQQGGPHGQPAAEAAAAESHAEAAPGEPALQSDVGQHVAAHEPGVPRYHRLTH